MDNEMGRLISSLRKEKNMTQQELADKLNITDKAVSKWERGLSYPDISLIPKLADILDIDPNKLLGSSNNEISKTDKSNIKDTIMLVFKCVGFALAVAVLVLNIIGKTNVNDSITLLSLSLVCIGITLLNKEQ
ncbi:helix-turn-helix domain-containing protein [Anaerofustis stercorihominis]|uniref:DNA-binding helix-turn-helix protein n=1 Tax=Anaerofustis stercorihominis DSM 17244 TaxID=445971 RepID=B1CB97_9FIRM|nr:helix-turn-helix transcriptional regulator [Anaerofustis stercorihominis]EDS71544.1 DNA-binding helix-turn-helix protein [Anaerofustis stercorihominis DSM 17244]MCQ4796397.1 helix-turn-helix domain-containing protein [Anaerofustis stercorihominis]